MPIGGNSGGGSNAIRAGQAYVEMFARDRLSPALAGLQRRMQAFAKFASGIGSGAMKAGMLMAAPLAGLFSGALEKSKAGVFGPQAQANAERFTGAWARAILSLQEGMLPVIEALIPLMEQFARIAKENKDILPVIAAVSAGLIGFGVAMKVLSAAITAASLLIGGLKLALVAATSPMLLVIGGIVGLAAAFADWSTLFGKLGETGRSTIQGVVDAFASGQIELAANIALAGLRLAWHDTIEWMKEQLQKIPSIIGDIAKMVLVLKAAQAGADIGSVFGPLGRIAGGVAGAGAGAAAVDEIDDAVARMLRKSDPAERARLAAELERLKKEIIPKGDAAPAPPRTVIESIRGAFSSPDFRRALGYGEQGTALDVAKKQLVAAEAGNELLAVIARNTEEVYT